MKAESLFLAMAAKTLWALSFTIILVAGCRKDLTSDLDLKEQTLYSKTLTVQQAKKWWDGRFPLSFRSDEDGSSANVSFLWHQAFQTLYRGEESIVIVPVLWDDIMKMDDRGRAFLVIYHLPDNSSLGFKWMGYYAPYTIYPRPIAMFNVDDFSGFFFEFDTRGYIQHILRIHDGQINGYHPGANQDNLNSQMSGIDFRDDEDWPRRRRARQVECPWENAVNTDDVYYNPGGCEGGWASFFQWMGGLINSIFSGPYTNNSPPYNSPFHNFGPGFNPGNESGPNNSSSLNQHFNNQIFHWTAEHAQLLEQFRVRNNIYLPLHVLMLIVNPSCFANPEMSDVPEDGDENAMYDQCVFWSMLNWVNERVNLTPEERNDLSENTRKLGDAVAFLVHLEASGFTNGEMESLMDRWFENFGKFDNLENPEEFDPPQEIENGINIHSTTIVMETPLSGTPMGGSPPRGNVEDLTYGTNGDTRGVFPMYQYPDNILFLSMEDLIRSTSIFDSQMQDVGQDFISRFRNKTGGDYTHITLTQKVKDHPTTRNYIKRFGKSLNDRLKITNGSINNIGAIEVSPRPQYGTLYDKFHGYQILIHDTEEVEIKRLFYEFNPTTKVWTGTFYFEITDHFGLDKGDVLTFQLGHSGFAAWWWLQHRRAYVPFRTKIKFLATISGKIE